MQIPKKRRLRKKIKTMQYISPSELVKKSKYQVYTPKVTKKGLLRSLRLPKLGSGKPKMSLNMLEKSHRSKDRKKLNRIYNNQSLTNQMSTSTNFRKGQLKSLGKEGQLRSKKD
jgi:hypothetical protein